jgi:hypothetical protein
MQCNVANCRRSGTGPHDEFIKNDQTPLSVHIILGKGTYLRGRFGFLHHFYRLDRNRSLSGLL